MPDSGTGKDTGGKTANATGGASLDALEILSPGLGGAGKDTGGETGGATSAARLVALRTLSPGLGGAGKDTGGETGSPGDLVAGIEWRRQGHRRRDSGATSAARLDALRTLSPGFGGAGKDTAGKTAGATKAEAA